MLLLPHQLLKPCLIQEPRRRAGLTDFVRSKDNSLAHRLIGIARFAVVVDESREKGVAGTDGVDHRAGGGSREATEEVFLLHG